ncbi:MAG: EamA family transporter RarD, partial [Pseudoxanthomonas sp.]|nr:EamA family transporter RarD [Pseudoxanthomonas sp.]MBP8741145.1 EamA family transporter RarD [Pseudoxanthomonas sp.]
MNDVNANLATPREAAIDRRGLLAAATAFTIWGVFPAYWHLLKAVPSMQIMAHRVVWSAVLVVGWLLWRQGWDWWRTIAARPRMLAALALSGAVIAFNWGLYIWAVNAGHVVETSLGYFINPLVTVALGVVVLRERLRRPQWIAVACAAAGVAWLTWSAGSPPWIALGLAGSFALYGLVRKLVPVDAVAGLGVESLFMFLPALAYVLWAEAGHGGGFIGGWSLGTQLLLVFSGVV